VDDGYEHPTRTIILITSGSVTEPQGSPCRGPHAPGRFPARLSLYEQDGLTQAQLATRVQIEQPTIAKTFNAWSVKVSSVAS
jgi:hypothetical protein